MQETGQTDQQKQTLLTVQGKQFKWTREYTRYRLIDSLRKGDWFLFKGEPRLASFGWKCRSCKQEGAYKPLTRAKCPVCGNREKFQSGQIDSNGAFDLMPALHFRAVAFEGTHYVVVKCDSVRAFDQAAAIGLEPIQRTPVRFEQDVLVMIHSSPSLISVQCQSCEATKEVHRKEKWTCPQCQTIRANWWARLQQEKDKRYCLVVSQLKKEKLSDSECRHALTHMSCAYCYQEAVSRATKRWVAPLQEEMPFDPDAELALMNRS